MQALPLGNKLKSILAGKGIGLERQVKFDLDAIHFLEQGAWRWIGEVQSAHKNDEPENQASEPPDGEPPSGLFQFEFGWPAVCFAGRVI